MSNNQHVTDNQHIPKEVRLEDLTPQMALPHNIFADMGLPNAETRQAKAMLSILIERRVDVLGLTQAQAAERLGLSGIELSRMVRGMNKDFEFERMLAYLNALGFDVDDSADALRDGLLASGASLEGMLADLRRWRENKKQKD